MYLFFKFKTIIMRFTLIFSICCVVVSMVTATDVMSQTKREADIDISLTDASLVSVIKVISLKTGYEFVYDPTILSQMKPDRKSVV
jgi:hypothetical protein